MASGRPGLRLVDFTNANDVGDPVAFAARWAPELDVGLFGLQPSDAALIDELEGVARRSDRLFVVTLGPAGAVALGRPERIHCPAHDVREVADTTGAGDAFTAGFAVRVRPRTRCGAQPGARERGGGLDARPPRLVRASVIALPHVWGLAPNVRGYHPRVAPHDTHAAFAEAAARDGVVLAAASFDWLLRAGARRARARREGPARSGARRARHRGARPCSRRSTRASGATSRCCTRRARTCCFRSTSCTRPTRHRDRGRRSAHFTSSRLIALELYPADAAVGFDVDGARGALPRLVRDERRARARHAGQGLRLRRRAAGARLPRRAARSRDAGDGPSAAHPDRGRSTATAPRPTCATATRCSRSAAPERAVDRPTRR